uniref:NADP-dependent oxidoreductase domain-containing protein n=1 Tax=Plectus sambesii TaxID=2011161 RepID=A0A914XSM1_9BILA
MASIQLSTGAHMPLLGLGTWQSNPGEVEIAVTRALEVGYRLIDTASLYANEAEIGAALHECFSHGKLKREDVFITTKLFSTHNRPEQVESALRESLSKLRLDYVDLYLIHNPVAFNDDMSAQDHKTTVVDTWKGMEGVFEKGLAKAIGLSNVNEEQVQRVYDHAKIKPHNVQVEAYLYFPQHELHALCKKLGITFTAFGPLGSPGRVHFQNPSGAKLEWAPAPNPQEDPIVKKLAQKHHKTPAQILLRWLIDRKISAIPKSTNAARIKENFEVVEFSLTADEVAELNSVESRHRLFYQDFLKGHAEDPFKNERHTK